MANHPYEYKVLVEYISPTKEADIHILPIRKIRKLLLVY